MTLTRFSLQCTAKLVNFHFLPIVTEIKNKTKTSPPLQWNKKKNLVITWLDYLKNECVPSAYINPDSNCGLTRLLQWSNLNNLKVWLSTNNSMSTLSVLTNSPPKYKNVYREIKVNILILYYSIFFVKLNWLYIYYI